MMTYKYNKIHAKYTDHQKLLLKHFPRFLLFFKKGRYVYTTTCIHCYILFTPVSYHKYSLNHNKF